MGSCAGSLRKESASSSSESPSQRHLVVRPNAINIADIDDSESEIIRFRNISETLIFYKVKVTHPKNFRFEPARGKIGQGSTISIQFSYNPEDHDLLPRNPSILVVSMEQTSETEDLSVDEAFEKIGFDLDLIQTTKVPIFFQEQEQELSKFVSIRPTSEVIVCGGDEAWWRP